MKLYFSLFVDFIKEALKQSPENQKACQEQIIALFDMRFSLKIEEKIALLELFETRMTSALLSEIEKNIYTAHFTDQSSDQKIEIFNRIADRINPNFRSKIA